MKDLLYKTGVSRAVGQWLIDKVWFVDLVGREPKWLNTKRGAIEKLKNLWFR